MVVNPYNPKTQVLQVQSQPGQHSDFKDSLNYIVKPCLEKQTKIDEKMVPLPRAEVRTLVRKHRSVKFISETKFRVQEYKVKKQNIPERMFLKDVVGT